jgi:S-disulfanyl-L-cysteine oxidoreductase SoxD
MRLYINCRPKFLLPAVVLLTCGAALAQSPTYKVGRAPTAEELRTWDNLVGPDGKELPAGKGTAQEGAAIFAARCAMCHGQDGVGNWPYARLTGGVGTLNTPNPIKTPASNMPYATTIFDFIRRAMPAWPMPKNLTPDNVYALTAFILAKSGIIKDTDVMDKNSLVEVQMPNRHGFYPDPPQDKPDDEDGTWLPLWEHAPQAAISSPGSQLQDGALKDIQGTVKVDGDKLKFVADDGMIWDVMNPEALKGYEGLHVQLNVHLFPSTSSIHVHSINKLKN